MSLNKNISLENTKVSFREFRIHDCANICTFGKAWIKKFVTSTWSLHGNNTSEIPYVGKQSKLILSTVKSYIQVWILDKYPLSHSQTGKRNKLLPNISQTIKLFDFQLFVQFRPFQNYCVINNSNLPGSIWFRKISFVANNHL